MENDRARYELKNVLGVAELPKECDRWNSAIWELAINVAKAGGLTVINMPNGDFEFIMTGPRALASLEAIELADARSSIAEQVANETIRNPLYETQLRLIGKLKAAIASSDGKREGDTVDVALERIVDEACVHFTRIRSLQRGLINKLKTTFHLMDSDYSGSTVEGVLLSVVSDACSQHQSRMSATESDYAATVKALSDAIQVLATEQKQTYASCNTLSNTLAEVVKNRMKLEESRSK